jgi:hypothetical protein
MIMKAFASLHVAALVAAALVRFRTAMNSGLTKAKWIDISNTPTLNLTNLQNQVTVPLAPNNRFYRLKQ